MIKKKAFYWLGFTVLTVISILIIGNNMPKTHIITPYELNLTLEEATQAADTIVVGTVKKVDSPKWNSKDGKEPDDSVKLIIKPTTIEVDQYLKNPQKDKSLQVINVGGRIENETIIVENSIGFNEGEKIIAFLVKDRDPGDGIKYCDAIWKYKVENDIAINENAINTASRKPIGVMQLQQQISDTVKLQLE